MWFAVKAAEPEGNNTAFSYSRSFYSSIVPDHYSIIVAILSRTIETPYMTPLVHSNDVIMTRLLKMLAPVLFSLVRGY